MSDGNDSSPSLLPDPVDLAGSLLKHGTSGASPEGIVGGILADTAEDTLTDLATRTFSVLTPAGRSAGPYERAKEHLEHYRYAEAAAALGEALELDSNSAYLWHKRGKVHRMLRQYDQAVRDCTRAIELAPDHADSHLTRSLSHYEQGNRDAAIADLRAALLYSRPEYRLRLQPYLHEYLGEDEQAFTAWGAVLAEPLLAWTWRYAHWKRGYLAEKLGRLDQALADYDAALEGQPDDVFTLNRRAEVYAARKEYPQAIADITLSIAREPRGSKFAKRGNWHKAQSQWAEALADYNEALRLDPGQNYIYWWRAVAHTKLDDRAAAIADYRTYIANDASPEWRAKAEQAIAKLEQA